MGKKSVSSVCVGKLPTKRECIDILKRVGCDGNVIIHCKTVEKLAVKIGKLCKADIKVVSVGALLHDIGRCRTHGITHGIEGANIAKRLGLPNTIVKIIERHVGAGITRTESLKLGLPPKNYIPRTLEEKIVAHADNLIEHDKRKPFKSILMDLKLRGLDVIIPRMKKLHGELCAISKTDLDTLH